MLTTLPGIMTVAFIYRYQPSIMLPSSDSSEEKPPESLSVSSYNTHTYTNMHTPISSIKQRYVFQNAIRDVIFISSLPPTTRTTRVQSITLAYPTSV